MRSRAPWRRSGSRPEVAPPSSALVPRPRVASLAPTLAALLAAPLALACSSPAPLASEAPADVRWIALAELDATGAVAHASALARWESDTLPVFAREGRDALILGYSDLQIAAAALDAAPSVLQSEPLRGAASCEPALPAPRWSARWREDALVADATSPPTLTASWVDDRCEPVTQVWVDQDCQDLRCAVGVSRSASGCQLDLDLSACDLDRPRATGLGTGLCVDFSATAWTCTPASVPEHAAHASTCRRDDRACTLTWYRAPVRAPVIDDHLLLPRSTPAWRPERAGLAGPLQPHVLARGYAWDLAPIGRRALVSVPVAPPRETCDGAVDGELVILDGDRRQVVGTATAPPCLTRLSPAGDAVLGLFVRGGHWFLGRFDADGRLLTSARADPRPTGDASSPSPGVDEWLAMGLVPTPAGWVAAWQEVPPDGGSVVFGFDAALAPTWRAWLPGVRVTSLRPTTGDRVALGTTESGEILHFDARTGARLAPVRIDARNGRPVVFLYDTSPAGDVRLVTSGTPPALFSVTSRGDVIGEALLYDREAYPQLAIPLPWAPEQAMVFGLTPDRMGTISTYLVEERRFLPGTRDFGPAPAARAVADAQQRIWVLQAWTGEVVLLTRP